MLAAESAIADQYATAMMNQGMSNHGRNYINENGEQIPINNLSQSYRNAGGVSGSHNPANSTQQQTHIYDKLRNSY